MKKKLAIVGICLLAASLISGCTTMANKTLCNLDGGDWIDKYGACCPNGCPEEEPSDATEQLRERCEDPCWLP